MIGRLDRKTLARRLPVWAAMSDLFLDTDVSIYYADIARAFRRSGYTLDDLEHIFFDEIAPVFYTNQLSDNRAWSAWPVETVREHMLDFFALSSFARDNEIHLSREVGIYLYEAHWGELCAMAWPNRAPPRRRRPLRLEVPRLSLPRLVLPRLSMRFSPAIPIIAVVLMLAFAGFYQAAAVMRARARTPEILEEAWTMAGTSLARDMPVSWLEALLRVEDPGFRRHDGVDFDTPGQGMTTITQALVKRLYFDDTSPAAPSLEESLIAHFVLDGAMSKDEQLDLFFNVAYFGFHEGREIVGFRNAAFAYYERPLTALTKREFLSLVAALADPTSLQPGTAANAERVARIERLLRGRCLPSGLRDVWLERCAAEAPDAR